MNTRSSIYIVVVVAIVVLAWFIVIITKENVWHFETNYHHLNIKLFLSYDWLKSK